MLERATIGLEPGAVCDVICTDGEQSRDPSLVEVFLIRRHTPFSPYVAPRFPHMSEINSLFSFLKERRLKRTGWSKTNAFHICITSYKLVIQDLSLIHI